MTLAAIVTASLAAGSGAAGSAATAAGGPAAVAGTSTSAQAFGQARYWTHLPASVPTNWRPRWASTGNSGPDPTPVGGDTTALEAAIAQSLLTQVNADRATHGLASLTWDNQLALSAHDYNRALSEHGDLTHAVPGYPVLEDRIGATGYTYSAAAENLGMHDRQDAQGALALHSMMMAEVPPLDGHRRTLLSPNYRDIGINVYMDGQKLWLTEHFGTRK